MIFELNGNWPPNVEEITWTEQAVKSLEQAGVHTDLSKDAYIDFDRIANTGQFLGTLLAASLEPILDRTVTERIQIAQGRLSDGWNVLAQGQFVDSVGQAAAQIIEARKEAV